MKRFLLALAATLAPRPRRGACPRHASDQPAEKKEGADVVKREEIVVVSASKVESTLINAPATMSVVTADTIATSPSQNYGDLLRSTPGINVIQTSARDINMTSRQATSTLANSQLVLLDGRSIYLDFFGLVLWDWVPQSQTEIKQIEVVRGPGVGGLGRQRPDRGREHHHQDPARVAGLRPESHGRAVQPRRRLARERRQRLSLRRELLVRPGAEREAVLAPVGGLLQLRSLLAAGRRRRGLPARRPLRSPPARLDASSTGGALYPPDREGVGGFPNAGTSQPKVDARVDQEFTGSGGRLTVQGGYAGTTGIVHTGIGPFDIESPSYMAYGKVQYTPGGPEGRGLRNFMDADAPNLILPDPNSPTLAPLQLNFKTQTYDFEFGHSTVLGGKHILSYGGNARRNNFDIILAPNAENRNEFGAYLQEEFFVDNFRVAAGGRVDKFGNLDNAVFSPRVSVMFKPTPSQSIRASFNRAFRSPSMINNYLEPGILNTEKAVDLTPLAPLSLPPCGPWCPRRSS